MPLNKLFVELRDKYNIHFSFNDKLLSKYHITVNRNFATPVEAIQSVLKDLPLKYIRQDNIYIILPANDQKNIRYTISGQIIEANTNETLPFANVIIDDRLVPCDVNGNFYFSETLFPT